MADGKLKFTISIDNKGNAVIKDMNGNIKKVEKSTVSATSNMSKGFVGLWKQMAGAGLAIAGLRMLQRAISDVVQDVIVFEKEFANVTTLLDSEGIKSAKMMEQGILDMAGALGSAEELTRGLYQTLSAGVEPGIQAMEFLESSAKFAQAGLIDMATSVDVLSTVVNAYGLAASDAAHVSDVLFQTIKDGKITGQELAASLGRVIPTASTLGIGLEEVSAAIAVMTKAGIKSEEAVTSLNASMVSLLKPQGASLKLAKEYGIELSKFGVQQAGGFQAWLADIKNKLGDNEKAMATLFPNIRALKAIFTLTGTSAKEYADELKRMGDVTGNVNEAFEKQISTFSGASDAIKNQLSAAIIETLLPALQKMAKWLKDNQGELIKAFEDIIGVLKRVGQLAAFIGKGWKALFDLIKTPANEAEIAMRKVDAKLLDIASTQADIFRGSKLGFFDQKVIDDSIAGFKDFQKEQKEFSDLREKHKKVEEEVGKTTAKTVAIIEELTAEEKKRVKVIQDLWEEMDRLSGVTSDYFGDLNKLKTFTEEASEAEKFLAEDLKKVVDGGKDFVAITKAMAISIDNTIEPTETEAEALKRLAKEAKFAQNTINLLFGSLSILTKFMSDDAADAFNMFTGAMESFVTGDWVSGILQLIDAITTFSPGFTDTSKFKFTEDDLARLTDGFDASMFTVDEWRERILNAFEALDTKERIAAMEDMDEFMRKVLFETASQMQWQFNILGEEIDGAFDVEGSGLGTFADQMADLNDTTMEVNDSMNILGETIADTFDVAGQELAEFEDQLSGLFGNGNDFNVNVNTPNIGSDAPPVIPIPGRGFASGGSFIIPPGYNENFQLGNVGVASSGEGVTITPANQVNNNNSRGSVTFNVFPAPGESDTELANRLVNMYNNNEGNMQGTF